MTSTDSSSMSITILRITAAYGTYAGIITCTTGIIGSLLNMFMFTNLKFFRSNRCVFYLTIESISNIIYQIFTMISTILRSFYGNNALAYSLIWCRLIYILSQSCGLTTYSMICCAAGDQFFSTNYRLNLRQMCTVKLAWYLIFIITPIWLIHSIVFACFVNIVPLLGCIISNPIMVRYATFFVYPILAGLLPVTIASLFSLMAFRDVRRIVRRQIPIVRRRFDRQITAMVLVRVVFFVFTALPLSLYRIYAVNVTISSANPLAYAIKLLIQQVITSICNLNFMVRFSSFFY